MVIVLFHELYLLGKYVYQNYEVKKRKTVDDVTDTKKIFEYSEADYMMEDPEASQDFVARPYFHPPAYMQRYTAVSDVLCSPKYSGKLRKVVDFGCSGFCFLPYLKRIPGVEEILCVDVDRQLLDTYHENAEPMLADYIHPRSTPLLIEVYEGSVAHNDKKLEDTDAVICIELIEHLYPSTFEEFPENIFGFIKPKVAIITTLNRDFNAKFPNFGAYRPSDHNFEWTRQQFQDWANNITSKYPDYEVTFDDICEGPQRSKYLGACTQMAIFHRHSEYRDSSNESSEGLFTLVAAYEYPVELDNRSDEEKIVQKASFYIERLPYQDPDMEEEIPLKTLLGMIKPFNISEDMLRTILEDAGYEFKNHESGPTVVVPQIKWSNIITNEGAHWSDVDSFTHEDDLDAEPGPPTNSNRYLEEDWNEEPSIVIPQNNSVVQDNTYLFDGDNIALDSGLDMRNSAVSAI